MRTQATIRVLLLALTVFAGARPVIGAQSYPLSVPGGDLDGFDTVEISPGGERLVYSVDDHGAIVPGLYSVSVLGTEPSIRLSRGPFNYVADAKITSDGRHVVYRADEDVNDRFELYSVPILGGTPMRLSTGLEVDFFAFDPVGDRVAYVDSEDGLYVVPAHGSALPVLLGASTLGIPDCRFSADGSHVVYRTGLAPSNDLYRVPSDASQPPVRLNDPRQGQPLSSFQIDPTSARVVYSMVQGGARGLFSVPIDRSAAPVRLDGVGGTVAPGFRFTPDGQSVVYLADEDTATALELYRVPIDASAAPLRVSGPLAAGGDVRDYFHVAPDGSRLVYVADQDTDEVDEIYSVPLDGSRASAKLNGTLAAGGDVQFSGPTYLPPVFDVSADSSRVVFLADRDVDDVVELYSAPLDGSAPAVELNASLGAATHRDVLDFRLVAGGRHVLYRCNEESVVSLDLRIVPTDGSRSSRALNAPGVFDGLQVGEGYWASQRGDLAFYLSDEDHDGLVRIYAAPLPKLRRGAL